MDAAVEDIEIIVDDSVTIPRDVLDRFIDLFQYELRYWHEVGKEDPDWDLCDVMIDGLQDRIERVKDVAIRMQKDYGINIRGGN
jgi:rRNA pseudouridine-1189 N-methylase Emg1 (Nep1/Mra1 family)